MPCRWRAMIIDVEEEQLVVISDLHLGNPSSRAAASIQGFLDYIQAQGFSLCLNGDAFEMLQTRFHHLLRDALPLMNQISRLYREGLRVYYVVGNHDIYVEHFLDQWFVTAVCPFLNVESGGKRIRVEHGHLYDPFFSRVPDLYESVTRLGGNLLFMRPDIYRLWDSGARVLDQHVRGHALNQDGLINQHRAAASVLRRGFDAVVYGHTHRPERTELADGLFVNSGAWVRDSSYVQISGGQVELKRWMAN
jgi:UDP-2,3-diacylglucosamine pyrophosphatase LpxH